jgi:hypothetical protein
MSAAVETKNGPRTAQKHGLKDTTAAKFGKGTLTSLHDESSDKKGQFEGHY